ncbi:uncharacterized protein [Nicotiana tomentosiformis]|uniref:uncharacterized protein n=1 Tax=Nicotiana tomentosiformis TaxID=4098 RepID=UPI00388C9278
MAKTSKPFLKKKKLPLHGPPATKYWWSHDMKSVFPVYVLISDFKIDKASPIPGRCEPVSSLGKDAVTRPPSAEEETSAPVPKSAKDNKRKRTSNSEDPKLKTRTANKPRKNTILLTEESVRHLRDEDEEEEENDGSILVARVKKTIDAPKAAGSMVVDEAPSRTEGVSEQDSGKVPESLEIEDASHRSQQTVDISEALRTEENAPRDSLGAIVIGDSLALPAFFKGAIREARALETLEVDGAHEGADPFHDLFTGIEDVAGPSDASALHQEEFSKSRAELSRREADFRGILEEINALKLLSGQKEEGIKDLRAELAKAHQDQTNLIEQKEGMEHLAAEKETARAQLSSVKNQLQVMKEKSSAQARKIEEFEARLASEFAKAEKAKDDTDAIVDVYRADAEAAQIHAGGFDLTEEILKAKELEADTGALAFDDDDDDNESGSESGEEPDGEEMPPEIIRKLRILPVHHLWLHDSLRVFVIEGQGFFRGVIHSPGSLFSYNRHLSAFKHLFLK